MLTRRQLLAGAGTTALVLAGLGRDVAGDPSPTITVYKSPT
jgi:hypothetical protein